jgi:hypothetical protein
VVRQQRLRACPYVFHAAESIITYDIMYSFISMRFMFAERLVQCCSRGSSLCLRQLGYGSVFGPSSSLCVFADSHDIQVTIALLCCAVALVPVLAAEEYPLLSLPEDVRCTANCLYCCYQCCSEHPMASLNRAITNIAVIFTVVCRPMYHLVPSSVLYSVVGSRLLRRLPTTT